MVSDFWTPLYVCVEVSGIEWPEVLCLSLNLCQWEWHHTRHLPVWEVAGGPPVSDFKKNYCHLSMMVPQGWKLWRCILVHVYKYEFQLIQMPAFIILPTHSTSFHWCCLTNPACKQCSSLLMSLTCFEEACQSHYWSVNLCTRYLYSICAIHFAVLGKHLLKKKKKVKLLEGKLQLL